MSAILVFGGRCHFWYTALESDPYISKSLYIYDLVNELDCSSTQTLPLQATGFQTSGPWTHTKLQAFRPAGPEHTPPVQTTHFQTSRPWTHTASPNHTLSDQQALNTHHQSKPHIFRPAGPGNTPPVQTTHFQTSRPWTHTTSPNHTFSDWQALETHRQSKPHTFRPAGPGHTPLDCSSTDTARPNHTVNLLALLLLCLVCIKQKTPKFMPVKETIYTSNAMQFGQGAPENYK